MNRSHSEIYNYKKILLRGIEEREKRRPGFRFFFEDFYEMVQHWTTDRQNKKGIRHAKRNSVY